MANFCSPTSISYHWNVCVLHNLFPNTNHIKMPYFLNYHTSSSCPLHQLWHLFLIGFRHISSLPIYTIISCNSSKFNLHHPLLLWVHWFLLIDKDCGEAQAYLDFISIEHQLEKKDYKVQISWKLEYKRTSLIYKEQRTLWKDFRCNKKCWYMINETFWPHKNFDHNVFTFVFILSIDKGFFEDKSLVYHVLLF